MPDPRERRPLQDDPGKAASAPHKPAPAPPPTVPPSDDGRAGPSRLEGPRSLDPPAGHGRDPNLFDAAGNPTFAVGPTDTGLDNRFFDPAIARAGDGLPFAPRGSLYTEEDAFRAEAIVTFHLSGSNDSLVQAITDHILNIADAYPEVLDVLATDFETALAYTDSDVRAMRADPNHMPSNLELLVESVRQEQLIIGAEKLWLDNTAAQADLLGGEWTEQTMPKREVWREANAQMFPDMEQNRDIELSGFDPLTAEHFGELRSSLSDRPGVWVFDAGILAGNITLEDGSVKEFFIEVDDDTTITNDIEAFTTAVLAIAGLKHEVVLQDDIPGSQTQLGATFEFIGNKTRDAEEGGAFSQYSPALDAMEIMLVNDEQVLPTESDVHEMYVDGNFTDAQMIGIVGTQFAGLSAEEGRQLDAGQAVDLAMSAADQGAFDPTEMRLELENMLTGDIIEQIMSSTDDDKASQISRIWDAGVEKGFSALEQWEEITQWIGVQTVDAILDGVNVVGAVFNDDDVTENWNAMFQEDQSDTVGDYFHLEGGLKEWADVTASIIFDPTNAIFAGGATRQVFMKTMLRSQKFGPMVMRTRGARYLLDSLGSGNTERILGSLGALQNFGDKATLAIINAHRAGTLTRDVAESIAMNALPAYGGTWIPSSMGHATTRQTALGAAQMFARFDSIPDAVKVRAIRAFTNRSVDRAFRFGSTNSVDDIKAMLFTMFPDDPDTAFRHLGSFIDARNGSVAQKHALEQAQQAIAQQIRDLGATVPRLTGKVMGQALEDARVALHAYDRQLATTMDDAARTALQAKRDALGTRIREITEAGAPRSDLEQQLNKIKSQLARIEKAIAEPELFIEQRLWMDQFWAEQGDRLGLEVKGVNESGITTYDWTPVTNTRKVEGPRTITLDDSVSRTTGLTHNFDDAADIEKELRELEVLRRSTFHEAPASSWEVTAYQNLKNNPRALQKYRELVQKERFRSIVGTLRKFWAVNLLGNPITGFKGRLDEAMGLFQELGGLKGFKAALDSSAGAVVRGSLFHPDGRFMHDLFGGLSDEAARYGANAGDTLATASGSGWHVMDNPSPGTKHGTAEFRANAERFLQGSLAQDELTQMWAKRQAGLITDAELRVWWKTKGQAKYDATELTFGDDVGKLAINSPDDIVGIDGYLDQVIGRWVDDIVDGAELQDSLRQRLIEAATGTGPKISRSADAELLQNLKYTVGPDVNTPKGSWLDGMMNSFWTRPQQRAGGVMFDQFYEPYRKVLVDAWTEAGILLEPSYLVSKKIARDLDHAAALIRTNDPRVRDLLGRGFKTHEMAEQTARAYAAQKADDLMYSTVTRSLAGNKLDNPLALPFVRAQADFGARWMRWMFDGNATRVSREKLYAWSQGSGIQRATAKGVELLERQPINVRLVAKMAHLSEAMTGASAEGYDGGFWGPGALMNSFTFLPLRKGTQFMMNISPQPGLAVALPWWAADRYAEIPGSDFVERIWPSFSYFRDNVGGNLGFDDIDDFVFPDSSRSIRSVVTAAGLAIAPSLPGNWGQQMTQAISSRSEPFGTGTVMKNEVGLEMRNSVWTMLPGTEEHDKWISSTGTTVRDDLWRREAADRVQHLFPGVGYRDRDLSNLDFYSALLKPGDEGGLLDVLKSAGVLNSHDLEDLFGDGEAFEGLWTKWNNGSISEKEAWDLYDILNTVVFDRLSDATIPGSEGIRKSEDYFVGREYPGLDLMTLSLLIDPAMGTNLVSTTACMPDAAGNYFSTSYCTIDGRFNSKPLAQGQAGRDDKREMYELGQIGYRPEGEWSADASERVHQAGRKFLRWAFSDMTNYNYSIKLTKDVAEDQFALTNATAIQLMDQMGIHPPTSSVELPGGGPPNTQFDQVKMTGQEWRDWFGDQMDTLASSTFDLGFMENAAATALQGSGSVMDDIEAMSKYAEDNLGIEYISDWPEEFKEHGRVGMREAIDAGTIGVGDYDRYFRYALGDLNWVPPDPPKLGSDRIEFNIPADANDLVTGDMSILDGDTLSLRTSDGFVELRLVGINTPEWAEPGGKQALSNLEKLLQGAETINFIMFDGDQYGRVQQYTSKQRIKVWMYVDGIPIWVPEYFTASNVTGGQLGGDVIDLQGILNAGKSTTPALEGSST